MKYVIVALIIFIVFCIAVIAFDSNRFVVREYAISSDKIKEDRTLVFLSDLHGKKYGKNNEKLKKAIDSTAPDCVLIGGDMMTAYPGEDFGVSLNLVTYLSGKYKYVYAEGNHEFRARINKEFYHDLDQRYRDELAKENTVISVNESIEITDDIKVFSLSIDREYYRRFKTYPMDEGYIESKVGKADEERFSVLLAHNPDYFDNYSSWGADLVLAGHVHGGVVRIPGYRGIISPMCTLFPKYDGGRFKKGDSTMIVSRGLGMHTIPFRMFNPAEIVVIKLSKEKQ